MDYQLGAETPAPLGLSDQLWPQGSGSNSTEQNSHQIGEIHPGGVGGYTPKQGPRQI